MRICRICKVKMKRGNIFKRINYVLVIFTCPKCGAVYQSKWRGRRARYYLDENYRLSEINRIKESRLKMKKPCRMFQNQNI